MMGKSSAATGVSFVTFWILVIIFYAPGDGYSIREAIVYALTNGAYETPIKSPEDEG